MEKNSPAEQRAVPCRGYDLGAARRLAAELKIDLFAAKFLVSRGFSSFESAADFLYPRLSRMHSPFLLDDIVPAVERIRRAIDGKERVAVFSDSDIDGLTSLAIIRSLLDGAKVPVVSSWPVGEENYGLSMRAVDEFAAEGATLLLTFDCGIRDLDEIAYARSRGMDVIVCDHHEQGPELPDAICVDQKRTGSSYPFRDLAGAGVAMKLCHAVLVSYLPMYGRRFCLITREGDSLDCRVVTNGIMTAQRSGALDEEMTAMAKESAAVCVWNILLTDAEALTQAGVAFEPFDHLLIRGGCDPEKTSPAGVKSALGLPDAASCHAGELAQEALFDLAFIRPKKVQSFLMQWLPLASLGTIADVMPVVGENRIIVACGLKSFGECPLPAIRSLNDEFGPVTAKVVAWNISPLLNTPGRIGRTELAAQFLLSRTSEECARLLEEISDLNDDRKDFLKKKLSQFSKDLERAGRGAKNFIYIKASDVTDGYTGLIAGRLADAHGCPAVVVSAVEGRGVFKGSGRASGGVDFLSHVEPFAGRFERFGGHASAFGFSASESVLDDVMAEIDRSLEGVVLKKKERVADFEIHDTGEISERSLGILALCEPFGAGNEPPLFLSRCVPVLRFESFGSDGRHGKFFCGGRSTAAIGWGMAEEMKDYMERQRIAAEEAGDSGEEGIDVADFLYSAEFDQYTKRVRFIIEELL